MASQESKEAPSLTLSRPDGSPVTIFEGSRLEWDVLAGIAIPGAGTVVGVGRPDRWWSFGSLCVHIDLNEGLRAMTAELHSGPNAIPKRGPHLRTGLDGDGGFLIFEGEGFARNVAEGTMRLLDERRNPETYRPALEMWLKEQSEAALGGFFVGPLVR